MSDLKFWDGLNKKVIMDLFNQSTKQTETQVSISVHKDKDGYNVIQIQEISGSSAESLSNDMDVLVRAAKNLDKSFAAQKEKELTPDK